MSITENGERETEDVTAKDLYSGRRKVIRIKGGNLLVREERSNRIIDVSPDDRIEPIGIGEASAARDS